MRRVLQQRPPVIGRHFLVPALTLACTLGAVPSALARDTREVRVYRSGSAFDDGSATRCRREPFTVKLTAPAGWRVRPVTFTGRNNARTGLLVTPSAKRYRGDSEVVVSAVAGSRPEASVTEAATEVGSLQGLPINQTRTGLTDLFAPNGDPAGALPSARWLGRQRRVPRHPDPGDWYAEAFNLTDLGESPDGSGDHDYVEVKVSASPRHYLGRGRARQLATAVRTLGSAVRLRALRSTDGLAAQAEDPACG
ncbi:MAG: hypothetical protein QOH76_3958 [Thermoleophilaceae bacterium]|jgi:hypothetical protein|nr:hypothetical protein [Thermoleophilaceae bacterium]